MLPLEGVPACVEEAWLQTVLQEVVASCLSEHQGVEACALEVEMFVVAAGEGLAVEACSSSSVEQSEVEAAEWAGLQ